jgi:hypothetical protein
MLTAGLWQRSQPAHRRQRWQIDGTLAKLMKAGAPAIKCMKIDYQDWLIDASLDNRQSASEFFGQRRDPAAGACRTARPLPAGSGECAHQLKLYRCRFAIRCLPRSSGK